MPAIARDSLLTLEAYAKERSAFRARVLAHKRNRIVHLGPHVTLLFEDELTIRYQIQEMLRIEKTFDESGIQQEVDAYNPLGYQTSAVHFVRFELTPAMIAAFKADTPVALSIDHPNYQAEVAMISPLVQETLASDFA